MLVSKAAQEVSIPVLAILLALTGSPTLAGTPAERFKIEVHPRRPFRTPANPNFHCPRTTGQLVDRKGFDPGLPLTPRKLTQLPPATTYMAVYRHVGTCEVPLTMTDYRNPRRR